MIEFREEKHKELTHLLKKAKKLLCEAEEIMHDKEGIDDTEYDFPEVEYRRGGMRRRGGRYDY